MAHGGLGYAMKKIRISNGDLNFIFSEKLRAFDECGQVSIAIVPDGATWRAVLMNRTNSKILCRRRMELVEKQLREMYILNED